MSSIRQKFRRLTDLEAVTIAYIQRREPCTPYEIRRSFEKSTTTRFSSSAGSIYPLIKRLHERDLLEMVDTLSDGRGTQQYSVTPKGRSMVRDWITGLGDPGMIGVYDPIGSRLLNLSLLPKDEQIEWLRKTIDLVKRQETVVRDYEEQEFVGDARLYEILRSTRRKESKLRQGMLQLALVALQEN